MTLLYWWLFYLKGGKPMETEVRAADGKKLFEWEPDGNVITIVIKQKKFLHCDLFAQKVWYNMGTLRNIVHYEN